MNDSFLSTDIVFLPFDVVTSEEGYFICRGVNRLLFQGKTIPRILKVLKEIPLHKSFPLYQVLQKYPKSIRWDALQLLFELYRRKYIVSTIDSKIEAKETPIDLFYWHFGISTKQVNSNFADFGVFIVGVNKLGLKVYHSLLEAGFTFVHFIDDPDFRRTNVNHQMQNIKVWSMKDWKEKIIRKKNCLIVCSESGSLPVFSGWNQYCVEQNLPLFPVYIDQLMGYVGPWVRPGETACLQCMIQRKNSFQANDKIELIIDANDFLLKSNCAYSYPLLNLCADHTAFEVGAHVAELSIRKYNSQLCINPYSGTTTNHKILKLPRCIVCSDLESKGSYSTLRITK